MVLNAIEAAEGHATVGEICETIEADGPMINRATVYRNIHFLHKLGLLVKGEIAGITVYELAYDEPHHHLVCHNCGHIAPLDNDHLQRLAQHLLEEHKFIAEISHLTIHGLCIECYQQAHSTDVQPNPA